MRFLLLALTLGFLSFPVKAEPCPAFISNISQIEATLDRVEQQAPERGLTTRYVTSSGTQEDTSHAWALRTPTTRSSGYTPRSYASQYKMPHAGMRSKVDPDLF